MQCFEALLLQQSEALLHRMCQKDGLALAQVRGFAIRGGRRAPCSAGHQLQ